MNGLNFKYRHHLINNACEIQKNNTYETINQCCGCSSCKTEYYTFMERIKQQKIKESLYTVEPSDLQQNYSASFNSLAQKASLILNKF